jgi:hypothetical protein
MGFFKKALRVLSGKKENDGLLGAPPTKVSETLACPHKADSRCSRVNETCCICRNQTLVCTPCRRFWQCRHTGEPLGEWSRLNQHQRSLTSNSGSLTYGQQPLSSSIPARTASQVLFPIPPIPPIMADRLKSPYSQPSRSICAGGLVPNPLSGVASDASTGVRRASQTVIQSPPKENFPSRAAGTHSAIGASSVPGGQTQSILAKRRRPWDNNLSRHNIQCNHISRCTGGWQSFCCGCKDKRTQALTIKDRVSTFCGPCRQTFLQKPLSSWSTAELVTAPYLYDVKVTCRIYADNLKATHKEMYDQGPSYYGDGGHSLGSLRATVLKLKKDQHSPKKTQCWLELKEGARWQPATKSANDTKQKTGPSRNASPRVHYPGEVQEGKRHDEGPRYGRPRFSVVPHKSKDEPRDTEEDVKQSIPMQPRKRGSTKLRQSRLQPQPAQGKKGFSGLQYGKPKLAPLDLFNTLS